MFYEMAANRVHLFAEGCKTRQHMPSVQNPINRCQKTAAQIHHVQIIGTQRREYAEHQFKTGDNLRQVTI